MSTNIVHEQLPSIDRQAGIAAGAGQPASPERVKALAAEFEAMLLGQMMQQMRASIFDSGDEDGDKSSSPLADALFSELSLALSRAGGLGLSQALVAPLIRETGAMPVDPAVLDAGAAGTATPQAPLLDPAAPLPLSPALTGRVSSAYGWRRDPIDEALKFHRGMDIAMPVGQGIPAPQAGTVTFVGEQPGYGMTVVVDHGGELTTRYAHLSAADVRVGDHVEAGQMIARSGATGRVTGPHLHIEVMEAGKSVNPADVLATYTASRPQ